MLAGIIQFSNKHALQLFGYKKGDLEGQNVSMLMPAPFNIRHNTYLKNYATTGNSSFALSLAGSIRFHGNLFGDLCMCAGKAKILDTVREVVAMHKERYVFPARIMVTKSGGSGADAQFMGVVKVIMVACSQPFSCMSSVDAITVLIIILGMCIHTVCFCSMHLLMKLLCQRRLWRWTPTTFAPGLCPRALSCAWTRPSQTMLAGH